MAKDKNQNDTEAGIDADTELDASKAAPEQNPLAGLEQELAQEKHAKLVAMADLENYRRRVEKERQDLMTTANLSILRSLIELVDDFERMVTDLELPDEEDPIDAFKPVLDKAKGILVDYGVTEIEAKPGDKQDPNQMEAIGTTKVENGAETGSIAHIAQKGYIYNKTGMVVRPVRVIVYI